jgi:hypothetical protein
MQTGNGNIGKRAKFGSVNQTRGVPQRREKGLGNGVKNLSGSADIPKLSNLFITQIEMLPGRNPRRHGVNPAIHPGPDGEIGFSIGQRIVVG